MSVAYIGPKSRTERPRKTKIGTEIAHVRRDSDTTFKVKRSNINLQGAGVYCGGLPHSLFISVSLLCCTQASIYVTNDATMPAARRQFENNQRLLQKLRLQRRQTRDNYYYNYDDSCDDDDYYYYNNYYTRPRSASVCGFRDVTNSIDDDTGLCVQRITVGPY